MSTTSSKLSYLYDTTKIVKEAAQASLYIQGRPLLPNSATFRDYALVLNPLERIIYDNFSDGTAGALYVPQPTVFGKQVLFQDSEGTIPVLKDGDPVGKIKDLSGNGFHATQPIDEKRPVYKTENNLHWLESDGDQSGIGKNLSHNLSLQGDTTMIVSAERLGFSGGDVQGLYAATAPYNEISTFVMGKAGGSSNWGSYGNTWEPTDTSILNNKSILTAIYSETQEVQKLYTNGVFSRDINDNYAGDDQDRRKLFSEYGGRYFNGRLYFAFSVNKALSDGERVFIEQQFDVLSS